MIYLYFCITTELRKTRKALSFFLIEKFRQLNLILPFL